MSLHIPPARFRELTCSQRAFAVTAAGIEGGRNLAESAKDMERIRKTMAGQLADFDTMKKALMKDLQDRCEKVRRSSVTFT